MDVTWNVTCIECDMECDNVFEDGPLWPVILKYHPDATFFLARLRPEAQQDRPGAPPKRAAEGGGMVFISAQPAVGRQRTLFHPHCAEIWLHSPRRA